MEVRHSDNDWWFFETDNHYRLAEGSSANVIHCDFVETFHASGTFEWRILVAQLNPIDYSRNIFIEFRFGKDDKKPWILAMAAEEGRPVAGVRV